MNIEVTLFGKIFLAELTLEWFYTLMFSDMNLKAGLLGITGRTERAGVRLHISVIHHVCFEVSLSYEGVVTPRIEALVRAVIRLNYLI